MGDLMDDISKSVHDDIKGGVNVPLEDAQKTYDFLEFNYKKYSSALPKSHKNDNLDMTIVGNFLYFAPMTKRVGEYISKKTGNPELKRYMEEIGKEIEDVKLITGSSPIK